MLGFDALGRLALGQIQQGGVTTIVMPAAGGSFALAGNAATFKTTEAAALRAFALAGVSASFTIKEAAGAGAFAYTGVAATFKATFVAAPGAFAFTGNPANDQTTEDADPGAFVCTFNNAPLTRTGNNQEPGYAGIGHYLEEMARGRRLAAITKKVPGVPIDRRTSPQWEPLRASPAAPIAPAVDMSAVQAERMAAAAAVSEAATKRRRRDEEALLLLAC